MLCLVEGLEGIALRLFIDVLGWKREEVIVMLAETRTGLKDKTIHPQYT